MSRLRQARCYEEAVKHWIDVAVYGEERYLNDRGHYGSRIWAGNHGQVYSYGTHFEMARVLYDNKHEPRMILISGDVWRSRDGTTARHQRLVREAVDRVSLPSVIIPFSALEAARIDINSVHVIEAAPERNIVTEHASDRPPRFLTYIDRAEYEHGEWSKEQRARWDEWYDWSEHAKEIDELRRKVEWGIEAWQEYVTDTAPDGYNSKAYWLKDLPKNYAALTEAEARGPKNLGRPSGYSHINANNVYRPAPPDLLIPTGERVQGYVHHHRIGEVSGVLADGTPVRGVMPDRELHAPDSDGQWRWSTSLHVLGESLISADVHSTKRVTCDRCEGDGITRSIPSLPGNHWWSYGERAVTRRRVPIPTTGREPYSERDYRGWNFWEDYDEAVCILPLPREHYDCSTCRGTGKVTKPYMRRGVKFLSGFDHGEPHLAYFFCELPKCDATTVDEAYEALKPTVVKLAEQMGRDVKRQGDIFAIETTATTKELKANAKAYGRRNVPKAIEEADTDEARQMRINSMLLGTNHQGTEVIRTKDGTIYARGCLWHVPDGRTNDHVRVKLGKAWHIIVKNTVPVRRA